MSQTTHFDTHNEENRLEAVIKSWQIGALLAALSFPCWWAATASRAGSGELRVVSGPESMSSPEENGEKASALGELGGEGQSSSPSFSTARIACGETRSDSW